MRSRANASVEAVAEALEGTRIKAIFRHAELVAGLHTTLTSTRGNSFRKQLLHRLADGGGTDVLERLRQEAGVQEYRRHLLKLLQFHLIVETTGEGQERYTRTALGEAAVNAMRELEREIDTQGAQRLYDASLGPHSIQLFLRLYADRRAPDFQSRRIRYTPREVGKLALFLPRDVEALAAIDKLNEAGLLAYEDDGYVYASPVLLRAVYKYLTHLDEILVTSGLILPKP